MKKVFLALSICFSVNALGSLAVAFPTTAEMKANFAMCNNSDSTWFERWGRYVMTFELNDAAQTCNAAHSGYGRPGLAGCYINGSYLYAGYVCYEGSHR